MPDQPVNQSTNKLVNYTLHLADTSLLLGHRNSEWCGHGPVLEQDIALTNISLDLIGQARNFYQYAAQLINDGGVQQVFNANNTAKEVTEDSLAYLRDASDFKNCLLVELPNGDWAHTILRQFLFSNYQYLLYEKLQDHANQQLAAIAGKSLKEVTYHLRWSSEWVIRLGDGTAESHQRMVNAVKFFSPYVAELFQPADYETDNAIAVNPARLQRDWMDKTNRVFGEAGLAIPTGIKQLSGGKEGHHTQFLNAILSEMQILQRTYPGVEW